MARSWPLALTTIFMTPDAHNDKPRPHLIQLEIPNIEALHAAYMPLLERGGIFVPTTRQYQLGDSVYVLFTLPGSQQRHPIAGRVAWITPARADNGRQQGVGVQFPDEPRSQQLKDEIEKLLGASKVAKPLAQTV